MLLQLFHFHIIIAIAKKTELEETEIKLMQKIEKLEGKLNKIEFDSQMYDSVKTKLEMKVHALDSDFNAKNNMVSLLEGEVSELNKQVSELSEKYGQQTEQVLELRRMNQKLDSECKGK